jgi:hypothetical protein
VLRPSDRRALRRHYAFDTVDDAAAFVAAVTRCSRPGLALAVCLDPQRQLLDLHAVPGGADDPVAVLHAAAHTCSKRTQAVLLLTDRRGEVLADRPDDEVRWQELVDVADDLGLQLVDWWLLFGDQAWSVAERSPTPARW